MKNETVIVVTGANTGLGYALARRLCQQYQNQGTAVIYLTARDETRGRNAVAQLQQEGLNANLHLLDVSQDQSVESFADFIRETHGGVDIVISNAAARISPDTPQDQQIENFINTNNYGTYRMIRAFAPLLKDGARFVVVASSFGSLRHLHPGLHSKFDTSKLALEDIMHVMDEYMVAVQREEAVRQGWPDWINIPSKVGQVALMKIFARNMAAEAKNRNILINAVCPGLVDTDASRPWFTDMTAAKSPDEAAVDVVWLATLPQDEKVPYGELIQYRRVLRFEA